MSFFTERLTWRTRGLYAVYLGERYQVFLSQDATLERLRAVFPGAAIYVKSGRNWIRDDNTEV
jgi:hypothetical protein